MKRESLVGSCEVQAQLADLVRKSVYIVLDNHGVVRRIENLGVQQLPFTMRAHMAKFDAGRYASNCALSLVSRRRRRRRDSVVATSRANLCAPFGRTRMRGRDPAGPSCFASMPGRPWPPS